MTHSEKLIDILAGSIKWMDVKEIKVVPLENFLNFQV